MPPSHRAELQQIRSFPSLIRFLRDEMGWPIESDDFEDLTFDYTPEELGIEASSAAKIEEIKSLRPLTNDQPWGIFFLKFERKRLPVVALRRILSAFAMHKRVSANAAERVAWETNDLLFISNFGEGEERQLSLAHFSQDECGGLPTLRVLGWDNLDTRLHLDHVADQLTEKLSWPRSESDVEQWRDTWASAFTLRHREVVATSKGLAERLSELARAIRDRIMTVLAVETEHGPLTELMRAFRTALVHDLDTDGFADMYAQTIAYGLLSARVVDPRSKTTDDLGAHMRANPLLRELVATFLNVDGKRSGGPDESLDFDELGVSEVVGLLDEANMEAILRDFGDRNPQEDPVIHFYELFLEKFDAKRRMQRGVFYTPRPVVSYIVRSVHELLQTEFGLVDGLADTATWGEMAERDVGLRIPEGTKPTDCFVSILDPATGTGTFLVEAIEVIHHTLVERWTLEGHDESERVDRWRRYVPEHLLPRLHGYELLMAPYAIAHLKIGLKLLETGYQFGSSQRVRVYLTNALEPPQDFSGQFDFTNPALAHEGQAVNEIKSAQRFTVVIGNPPYSHMTANPGKELRGIVDIYRDVDGERIRERGAIMFERTLQDDYVKFHALADRLTASHPAIRAYVTNSAYIDNPTLRGMRCYLAHSWDAAWLLDLNGDVKRGIPGDENVFDIRTGVAVSVFLRGQRAASSRRPVFGELEGKRTAKYAFLGKHSLKDTEWTPLMPSTPYYLLRPQSGGVVPEIQHMPLIHDVFAKKSEAIKTNRDHFVIGDTDSEVLGRIRAFIDPKMTTSLVKQTLKLNDNAQWSVDSARRECRATFSSSHLAAIAYRPFDDKRIYYHPSVVFNPRPVLEDNVLGRRNLVFLTSRRIRTDSHAHFFVTNKIAVKEMLSSADNCNSYPLYRFEKTLTTEERLTNFTPEFLSRFAACLGVEQSGPHGLPTLVSAEDILHYIYAVFYSPGYRNRYAAYLRIDYPRLPLPGTLGLFRALADLGRELVALHIADFPTLEHAPTTYIGQTNPEVSRVGWSDDTVWLDAAATKKGKPATPGTKGFQGVPEAVWTFHIGGYQVCEKWLKDRKGRTLSDYDIAHYQKIVAAIADTIRIMGEIDEVIEEHGSWPGAFSVGAGD